VDEGCAEFLEMDGERSERWVLRRESSGSLSLFGWSSSPVIKIMRIRGLWTVSAVVMKQGVAMIVLRKFAVDE
jgi:hypothetical protein